MTLPQNERRQGYAAGIIFIFVLRGISLNSKNDFRSPNFIRFLVI